MGALVWGILKKQWFIEEIGALFLAMGLVMGIVAGLKSGEIATASSPARRTWSTSR